jgi:alkanesulfonate monooxygenase SsuD/methylene tetrahydromethanopterin reductase-like flavin-dependent oxidoreductase (luciferase family)
MPTEMLQPPGYTSPKNMARYAQAGKSAFTTITYKQLLDEEWIFVGTPESVRERLVPYAAEMDVGHLIVLLQFGSMPDHLARKNMELFANFILPELQPLNSRAAATAQA